MKKINNNFETFKKYIESQTNSNSDYVFKKINFYNQDVHLLFCDSLTDKKNINQEILSFFEERKLHKLKLKEDIFDYINKNITSPKKSIIETYEDVFYYLANGFTLIFMEGYNQIISIETRIPLNSNIAPAQNETVIKGPKDAFTENYQINLGMIRKRIKSEKLWIKETVIGKYSKTKIGVLYVKGLASEELVKKVYKKIDQINVDTIEDSNDVIELITGYRKNVFPTHLYTERPDLTSYNLLEGKIVLLVENNQTVVILPITFYELFDSPEDRYQKVINASYTKFIRILAFLITILTPAIYIAMTTYNHEAIPSKLLVNLAIQREGVPLPAIAEILLMIVTFEILKETDTRIPSVIGSSLSIVGALVLGEASVTAGIVSPIMVIVVAITSISGFIVSNFDTINGIRFWRLLFIFGASLAGIIGIFVVGLMMLINLNSVTPLGVPFLAPLAPLSKKDVLNALLKSNKNRFFTRRKYMTKNMVKGRE